MNSRYDKDQVRLNGRDNVVEDAGDEEFKVARI